MTGESTITGILNFEETSLAERRISMVHHALVASYKSFQPGVTGVEATDAAAMLLATFAEMRKADFRYECSELVERTVLSSRADALTAPAA